MVRSLAYKMQSVVHGLDKWQQSHPTAAFLYAILRKYLDDEAGLRAALLAYYTFLSLFPLLLVLTTLFRIVLHNNPSLSNDIIHAALDYFPAVGRDLQANVHSLGRTGLALLIGVALTLFGARGVADVLRGSLDHIWQVPYARRSRMPAALFRSLAMIIIGGLGFSVTPVILGYVFAFAPNRLFGFLSTFFTIFVLFWIFVLIIKVGTSVRQPLHRIWLSAITAVASLGVLQSAGGYIMAHELQRLDSLYGAFALVLGLIFWLYIQAQVLFFALEIDSVRHFRLWPRSLAPPQTPLTKADHDAYKLYSDRARYHPSSDDL